MIKHSDIPIYGGRLIMVTTRKEAVLELMRLHSDAKESIKMLHTSDALSHDNESDYFIYSTRNPADVAHEAVHIGNRILQTAGIKTSQKNDEQLAYLVGYIVHEFMDKVGWKVYAK